VPAACFGPKVDGRHTFSHACATIAMCEALASSKQLPWRNSAEEAVRYAIARQSPNGGWPHGTEVGGDDALVTGWMVMALWAARDAGIPFDETAAPRALAFLDSAAAGADSRAAVAMCAHAFSKAADRPSLAAGAARLSKTLPVWDETKDSIDLHAWYWGTLAMFQAGGPEWDRWNRSLKTALIDHQSKSGCAAGSWDPKGPRGAEGGRVAATALMTLCLEVYYRYPRK
jgi:hypothetical protein